MMDMKVKEVEVLQRENRELQQQASRLEVERNAFLSERDTLQLIAEKRAQQARRYRRLRKKADKLLTLAEDRSYSAGFDEAVKRVHAQGWDHLQILGDFEDPLARPEEPDLPLEVSSGPESELSD